MSDIEWTEQTWNPIAGCTRKSPGCQNCYAEVMAKRLAAMGQKKYQGLLDQNGRWNGVINYDPDALKIPLKRKKPTMYFVNSMSDIGHHNVPEKQVVDILTVCARTPQHTYQMLTKRPERLAELFNDQGFVNQVKNGAHSEINWSWPLPNVWIGTSVENQQTADERILELLKVPAKIRFLSMEPLLERVTLDKWLGYPTENIGIGWIIIGGESGPNARPFGVHWAGDLIRECKAFDVPVFVKQLGKSPFRSIGEITLKDRKGGDPDEWPAGLKVRQMP